MDDEDYEFFKGMFAVIGLIFTTAIVIVGSVSLVDNYIESVVEEKVEEKMHNEGCIIKRLESPPDRALIYYDTRCLNDN